MLIALGMGCARFPKSGSPKVDGGWPPAAAEEEEDETCSSSIGRNSDCSGMGSDSDGEGSPEVQSRLKGPLELMDALQASLPVRTGISKFYGGKSKSFTSLTDAAAGTLCARDLAKPENPYTRKRKDLLTLGAAREKNAFKAPPLGGRKPGGDPKRAVTCNGNSSSSGSNGNSSSEEEREPSWLRPPLPLRTSSAAAAAVAAASRPEKRVFSIRSLSMTDLVMAAGSSFALDGGDED